MDYIGKNEQILDLFSKQLSILDGQLIGLNIYEENMTVMIELDIQLMHKKARKCYKFKFIDVQEYSFYYNKDHIFYNISSYKFTLEKNLFYISLDPDEMKSCPSANDQDFISSVALEAYSL